MSDILFSWHGPGSLAEQITAAIRRITVRIALHGRPIAVTLWHSDGTGLRIEATTHDISKRMEIGVLKFSLVGKTMDDEVSIEVPTMFEGPFKAAKLVRCESGTCAESGLSLEASSGERIVIVAGAFPYTLALDGVLPIPHAFEPEYPLAQYNAYHL